jgi:ABC-type molybdate transport system ATPase subunit
VISLCNRVIWIDDGIIRGDGNPTKIVNKYLETVNQISQSQIDLTKVDRTGDLALNFTQLEMINAQNAQTSSFNVGEDISLKFRYFVNDSSILKSNVQIRIAIHNSNQVEVLNLNNEVAGYTFQLDSSEGQIICKIPRIPLGEGTYSINLQAIINTGVADWINEAGTFEILPGDYYKTGIIEPNKANFYCDSEWEN